MSIPKVTAEELAELFHYCNQDPAAGGATVSWDRVPPSRKQRLIAAAGQALQAAFRRRYYPVPGEAQWGC